MGCGASSLPRNSDDREIDEFDIAETGIEGVDEKFNEIYAPVVAFVAINNTVVESADAIKQAGAAALGAFNVRYLVNQTNGVHSVVVDILDSDANELDEAAKATLLKEHLEFGKLFAKAKQLVTVVNKEFEKVDNLEKKPALVDVKNGVKICSKDAEGKRFICPPLNRAVDNLNKHTFDLCDALQKASLKDGFNLNRALVKLFENIKDELKDKLKPSLEVNADALVEGKLELAMKLMEEGDPADVLPEPVKSGYLAIIALIETMKTVVAELGELIPKVEAVAALIGEFDAVSLIKEAGLPPLKMGGAIKAAGGNAALAGRVPGVVKHTPETLLATLGDFEAAFKSAM